MDDEALEQLQARVGRLEDEAAITRLVMSYGPAADAGLTSLAGGCGSRTGSTTGTPSVIRISAAPVSTRCSAAGSTRA